MSVSAVSGGSSPLQKLASIPAKAPPKPQSHKTDADHDGSTTESSEKSGHGLDMKA